MSERLPDDALGLLRDIREVDIETRPAPDVPPHRTTIWVVVDDRGRAFIRAYRGPGSRWYREAVAAGSAALLADGTRLEVTLEHAMDQDRLEACSAALKAKYAGRPGLPGMLTNENLPTTLELLPVPDPGPAETPYFTPSG
jgi:hypothetical protein